MNRCMDGYLQFRNQSFLPYLAYSPPLIIGCSTRGYATVYYAMLRCPITHKHQQRQKPPSNKTTKPETTVYILVVEQTRTSRLVTLLPETYSLAPTQLNSTHTPQPPPSPGNLTGLIPTHTQTPTHTHTDTSIPPSPLTAIVHHTIIRSNSNNAIPQPLMTNATDALLTNNNPPITPTLSLSL